MSYHFTNSSNNYKTPTTHPARISKSSSVLSPAQVSAIHQPLWNSPFMNAQALNSWMRLTVSFKLSLYMQLSLRELQDLLFDLWVKYCRKQLQGLMRIELRLWLWTMWQSTLKVAALVNMLSGVLPFEIRKIVVFGWPQTNDIACIWWLLSIQQIVSASLRQLVIFVARYLWVLALF